MLVLSRKPSQRIQIGESIVVTVVRVDGNTVRLGIEAPPEVHVLRHELLDSLAGRSYQEPTDPRGGRITRGVWGRNDTTARHLAGGKSV
jgi:carbon storage regulator